MESAIPMTIASLTPTPDRKTQTEMVSVMPVTIVLQQLTRTRKTPMAEASEMPAARKTTAARGQSLLT